MILCKRLIVMQADLSEMFAFFGHLAGRQKIWNCEFVWAHVNSRAASRDWYLQRAIDVAVQALADDKTVVVHCMQGKHRTGSFCALTKALAPHPTPMNYRAVSVLCHVEWCVMGRVRMSPDG